MGTGCQLYIYYAVDARCAPQAINLAQGLLAELMQQHAGLQCRLLRRPDNQDPSQDGRVTLMEVHARDSHAAGIDASLAQAIEQTMAALSAYLHGPRQVERFVQAY